MKFKVKFLKEAAGRKAAHVEELSEGNETLVREWERAGVVEILKGPEAQEGLKPWETPARQEKAPEGPPIDRAIKNAPIRRRG